MRTFSQRYGWTKLGRSRDVPSPNTRFSGGTPSVAIWISLVRDGAWPVRHDHHCCALAWPSSVPRPVIPTLRSSRA
jgi:hypothetical protein